MVSEEELGAIFSEIGKEFGYDTVTAEYMAMKDFKVRWQRSYRWADFKVSDYLMGAPPPVVRGLCRTLYSKIVGKDEAEYPQVMCDWVTSPDFSRNKQPEYLRRSRNLTRTTAGKHKDLRESYARLVEAGLVNEDESLYISWSETSRKKAGSCSVLMRVVSISNLLDSEETPDSVLDYCLYREICHIMIGFDPTGEGHPDKFLALEAKFPGQAEAEEWLSKMCISL